MKFIKRHFFKTWKRTTCTVVVLLLGTYTLAGFILIPWLARPRIVETIAGLTGRETHLQKIGINPFVLSVRLTGFEIIDHDGSQMISLESGYANIQILPILFNREFHLKELHLEKPYCSTRIDADGNVNYADIIERMGSSGEQQEPAEPDGEPYHVQIDLMSVRDGSIEFADASMLSHFTTKISPISFEITDFHTSGVDDAPYAFSATTESGESLKWKGFVALAPVRSKGIFEATGISLSKYNPFYEMFLLVQVAKGTIDVSGEYEYIHGGNMKATLSNGRLATHDLQVLKQADQDPLLSLGEGVLADIDLDAAQMSIRVSSVRLSGGRLRAQRLGDGTIDLAGLVKPGSPSQTVEPVTPDTKSPGAGLQFLVESIALDEFSVEFFDKQPTIPVLHAIDQLALSINNLQGSTGSNAEFSVSGIFRSGGSVESKGSFSLQPIAASLQFDLAGISLNAGDPYVSEFADIRIPSGTLDISGEAMVDLGGEEPAGTYTGDIILQDCSIVSGIDGSELASLTQLALNDISAGFNPMALSIGTVDITNPHAEITILEDGTTNLAHALRIMAKKDGSADATDIISADQEDVKATTAPVLPFPVSIGSISLNNAGVILTDRSISPAVQLGLKTLTGTVDGLSSEELARADLQFNGELVGGTKLSVKGKINPLIADQYSDMSVVFKGFNLAKVSPYAGKYAGYALSKGQLSFEMNYQVSHATLSGENLMQIDQLTLGEKVQSEDALNLPIPLAIALLKDKAGMIEIDIPVSGNLNDPEFSLGRVIGRAVFNVITKVITSPFSMLAKLASGGDDVDLSRVLFAAGSTELDAASRDSLSLLAKALSERPNLRLDITGAAGGADEMQALRMLGLDYMLKAARWRELKESGSQVSTIEEVVLNAEDRSRLIQLLFIEIFPQEAAKFAAPVGNEAPPQPDIRAVETAVADPDSGDGLIKTLWKKLFAKEPQEIPGQPEAEIAEQESQSTGTTEESVSLREAAVPSEAELEQRILKTIHVGIDDLRRLAEDRAETVRLNLTESGGIDADRLFVNLPDDPSVIDPDTGRSEAIFNLE